MNWGLSSALGPCHGRSSSAQTLGEKAGCGGLGWVGVAVAPNAGPRDVLDSVTDLCGAAASLGFLACRWAYVPCSTQV